MTTIAVRVREDDTSDLQALLDALGAATDPEVAHPFDGETVVQAIVVLGAGAFPFFRAWVEARTAQRKHFSIVTNGTELKGYTAQEAQFILTTLAESIPELPGVDEAQLNQQPDQGADD